MIGARFPGDGADSSNTTGDMVSVGSPGSVTTRTGWLSSLGYMRTPIDLARMRKVP